MGQIHKHDISQNRTKVAHNYGVGEGGWEASQVIKEMHIKTKG